MGLKKIMDYIKIIFFNDVIHFFQGMKQQELNEKNWEIGNGDFRVSLISKEKAFSNSSQWDLVKYKAFNRYQLPNGYISIESMGKNDYLFFEDEMYIVRRLYMDMMIVEDENTCFKIFNSGWFIFDFVSRGISKVSKDERLFVDENVTV